MNAFLRKILLFVPLLLSIAVFNWNVDPACLFVPGYEERIVSLLLQGKNIIGPMNHNDRRQQVLFAEAMGTPRDVYVFGSSRTMGFTSSLFSPQSFYNAWVSGAVLRDYVGIYNTFRRRDRLPKTLVLGLDPWLFNRNNPQNTRRYPALETDYHLILDKWGMNDEEDNQTGSINLVPSPIALFCEKYSELLSPAYLQQSITFLRTNRTSTQSASALSPGNSKCEKRCREALPNEEPFRYADGSWLYPRAMNNRSEEASLVDVANATKLNLSLENYTAFDPWLVEEFERLVSQMIEDKVQVIFYLPPLHPILYNKVSNSPEYHKKTIEAEQYFRNYAQKNGISVRGSYNPQACRMGSADFVDGWHLRNEAFGKAFQPADL